MHKHRNNVDGMTSGSFHGIQDKQMREIIKQNSGRIIETITPGTYGLNSGGAHSFGTLINLSKSSNMLTAKICDLSNLYPFVFSLASSASCNLTDISYILKYRT